ncbi:MAG: triose-phosphate isomerase [Thaumarchaeota archaeon]|nr:MAG: triose-phosphate isomerase [Nitrososphaerota archaeon]
MKRPLIINFKNYTEVSGEKAVKLAKAAQTVARKLKVEIVVAPPQPALATVAKKVRMPVICQHVDDEKVGSSTGYFVPEIAKSYGAVGSLINHSEHRIEMKIMAVSKENPAIITKSIEAAGSRSKVVCGAGITGKGDVAKAMDLGSHGILVASGIIKASSWVDKIADLAAGMR